MDISELTVWFKALPEVLSDKQKTIATEILKENIDTFISSYQTKGTDHKEYQFPVPDKAVSSLNDLLFLCRKKNIYVIGFLSPYPASLYKEISNFNERHNELASQFSKTTGKIFADNGFELYDFSDISVLGLDNNSTEFIDAIHGTDKLYLRMIIYSAERNQRLRQYVDVKKDKQLLKDTEGDFLPEQLSY